MSSYGQGSLGNIKERSVELFKNMKFCDCSFRVEQTVFGAHKLILAMASPVFETMFYGQLAEQEYPIEITDVEPEIFAIIMEYMYTDRMNIGTFDEATKAWYAAQKYMLLPVVDHCVVCVQANLGVGNVCRAYELAKLMEVSHLKERCLKMIKSQTVKILADPEFGDISTSTLRDIFEMDDLHIDSELVLFTALESYVSNSKQPMEDTWKNATIYHNLLENIRFLTMSPKEFSNGPSCSKLLQMHEKIAILMNITSYGAKEFPMPEGFSTNRVKRQRLQVIETEARCLEKQFQIFPFRTNVRHIPHNIC